MPSRPRCTSARRGVCGRGWQPTCPPTASRRLEGSSGGPGVDSTVCGTDRGAGVEGREIRRQPRYNGSRAAGAAIWIRLPPVPTRAGSAKAPRRLEPVSAGSRRWRVCRTVPQPDDRRAGAIAGERFDLDALRQGDLGATKRTCGWPGFLARRRPVRSSRDHAGSTRRDCCSTCWRSIRRHCCSRPTRVTRLCRRARASGIRPARRPGVFLGSSLFEDDAAVRRGSARRVGPDRA
jgi:hypothetical protein